jgi:hypothetical protein
MYTVGEVAAAVCVLDALVEALPVFLLTVGGEYRPLARPVGDVWTSARVSDPDGEVLETLRARRKLPVTGAVSIYDSRDRHVAEMSATFNARVLSATMAAALVGEVG